MINIIHVSVFFYSVTLCNLFCCYFLSLSRGYYTLDGWPYKSFKQTNFATSYWPVHRNAFYFKWRKEFSLKGWASCLLLNWKCLHIISQVESFQSHLQGKQTNLPLNKDLPQRKADVEGKWVVQDNSKFPCYFKHTFKSCHFHVHV